MKRHDGREFTYRFSDDPQQQASLEKRFQTLLHRYCANHIRLFKGALLHYFAPPGEEERDACMICGWTFIDENNVDTEDAKDFRCVQTDHEHRTGTVRGVLCRYCNMKLGHLEAALDHFGDSLQPSWIDRAMKYLKMARRKDSKWLI